MSLFLPGFPRLVPGSITAASFAVRVTLTQPANISCAIFQLRSYISDTIPSDVILGNTSDVRADFPVPIEPATLCSSCPPLISRLRPWLFNSTFQNIKQVVHVPGPRHTNKGHLQLRCLAYLGPACSTCPVTEGDRVVVNLLTGRNMSQPCLL